MSTRTPPGKPPEVVVAASEDEKAKGRSFAATLFAWVEADRLWEGGSSDTEVRRPVYAVLGCDDGAASFVKANIRLGRRLDVPDGETGSRYDGVKTAERWEFLKSGAYRVDEQRIPGVGSMLEVRMPSLLLIEGDGMVDPKEASFVMLPTRAWCEAQHADNAAALRHLRAVGCKVPDATLHERFPYLAATGALFCAYLDRRTRCPIPADPRLYVQIMVGAIQAGLAGCSVPVDRHARETPFGCTRGLKYSEHGLDRVGLLPGVAFKALHEKLEPFLAAEVAKYLRVAQKGPR